MNQALAHFERYIKRRFGQTSNLKHYISDLNIFIDTVGNKAPEAVTAEDIDSFVDSQIAAGLSPTSINRRLASVHTFFEFLASEKPERDWPNPVIRRRHKLKTGSHYRSMPRIHDETLYEQFKTAMSRLEAIAVHDWPGVDTVEPALAETWTEGPA